MLAHVLVSKYTDHLPLYRQSEIYAREGLDLDRDRFVHRSDVDDLTAAGRGLRPADEFAAAEERSIAFCSGAVSLGFFASLLAVPRLTKLAARKRPTSGWQFCIRTPAYPSGVNVAATTIG